MGQSLLEICLGYSARGWKILPLVYKKKTPAIDTGLNGASADPEQVTNWFSKSVVNVGIRTGKISGIVVLDIDAKSDGLASLDKLQERYGALPDTYTVATGGGGVHFYFAAPNVELRSGARLLDSDGMPGVDLRAEGGYVVAPPSLHQKGTQYQLVNDVPPAVCPAWLIDLRRKEKPKVATKSTKEKSGNGLSAVGEGGRNDFLTRKAGQLQRQGNLTVTVLDELNHKFCNPPLDLNEVEIIANSISRKPVEEDSLDDLMLMDWAKLFKGAHSHLISWAEGFYEYEGGAYRELPAAEISNKILFWLNVSGTAEIRKKLGTKLVSDFRALLSSVVSVPPKVGAPPARLDDPSASLSDLLFLKNGILTVEDHQLLPHDPVYFVTSTLPVVYDPDAVCPTFDQYLASSVPDATVRNLLQEWVGYCLVPDTSAQKFMILEGDGANGKTVFLTVLRALLGEDFVSSVGIEGFDAGRSFQLASTVGKLANIVDDMSEVDKLQEGLIKTYVAGAAMTAERKYGHPFSFKPTARLTVACNRLPRFSDRSDGIWRRLLVVPFDVTIAPEAQDGRLVNPAHWRPELPGILNWALEGLRRVRAQGFSKSERQTAALAELKAESNITLAFFQDHLEVTGKHSDCVGRSELIKKYQEYCADHGAYPLGHVAFHAEVRHFGRGSVVPSKNAVWVNGKRDRVFSGVRWQPEVPVKPPAVTSQVTKRLATND